MITGSWTNNNSTEKKSFSKFRNEYRFEDRINESINIMLKYPDRIPVICEKGIGRDNPNIDKNKYLVPMDLTVGNFIVVIRKKIKLQDYEALFLMVNNTIPPSASNFKELYHKYKDTDGYLYMTYTKENVFG
jgi:GABA(A) receptor-associated protein